MRFSRNYWRLTLGQSLANIGDVLYTISVISVVYRITDSAAVAAFVPFTVTISMFLSSMFTPLLIGKLQLNRLLTGSQLGKTLCLFGLALLLSTDMTSIDLQFLFIIIAMIALQDGCANPIKQTLIPYYVEEFLLLRANSVAESITQTIQIGTWYLGSMLLVIWSPTHVIWLVLALYSGSSMLMCLLDKVNHVEEQQEQLWKAFTRGWKTIRNTPLLLRMAWIELLETLAGAVWIAAILFVYVEQVLQAQPYWWGYINSACFMGLVFGSLLCMKIAHNIEQHLSGFILAGAGMTTLFTFGFGLTSIPVLALILSTFIGLAEQIKNIPLQTVIQTSVPPLDPIVE